MSSTEEDNIKEGVVGEEPNTIKEVKEGASVATPTPEKESFSAKWTRTINSLHEPYLKHFLHPLTQLSGRNPKCTVMIVILLTFGILAIGLATNFKVEVDGDELWTPQGVRTVEHRDWINNPAQSGYELLPRTLLLFVHANGQNILNRRSMDILFAGLDGVRNLPGYDKACEGTRHVNPVTQESTCEIEGAVRFWNYTSSLYQSSVATEEDLITALSKPEYPDGVRVLEGDIFGYPVRNPDTGLLEEVQSFTFRIRFPDTSNAADFEVDAIEFLSDMSDALEKDPSQTIHMEFIAERSIDDEIDRAIVVDIPLVPIVFVVMGIFTAMIFYRRNQVQSRSFLGFMAVVSVLFSIMSGYGFMFLVGISFTSMTQILPFVIFGVGLDDSFVIMGAYTRTDVTLDPLRRIYLTMDEVGTSITLTTLTTALAFGLGCLSAIPAVYWLCLYAVPTIIFVYMYQLTFFVGAIVLDEKRIAENRRDWVTCITVKKDSSDAGDDNDDMAPEEATRASPSVVERFIEWYADFILQPKVKIAVVIAFSALVGMCAWSASKLEQSFDVKDVMPKDSYASRFIEKQADYTERSAIAPFAYFRNVDQSLPAVHEQMKDYVDDLVALDTIPSYPTFFWLIDFEAFVQEDPDKFGTMSFNDQLDAFLGVPANRFLYGPDIVRDEVTGDIETSRVRVYMDNLDLGVVSEEVDALEGLSAVAKAQEVNQGQDEYAFFTYDYIYQIWEFYAACVDELILTTILGVVTVTGIALLFVPHWTAALFVLPLICILYVDLLGVMQWGGVTIDPVSYVACVMSIGLLVDFILHVLMRYYECPGNRHEKTVAMLKSMGVSILTGGISTFLGTIPLAFSTSTIFQTIYIAFLGLSTLGVGHGLILLPVVLSTIGPEDLVVRSGGDNKGESTNYEQEEIAEV